MKFRTSVGKLFHLGKKYRVIRCINLGQDFLYIVARKRGETAIIRPAISTFFIPMSPERIKVRTPKRNPFL